MAGTTPAATKKFYVAISIWGNVCKSGSVTNYDIADSSSPTTYSMFKLTWSKGTWNTDLNMLAAPAAMTAAGAASTLSGIVGARALAASAAAAFGAAAALY